MNGGAGNDSVSYATDTAAVRIDLLSGRGGLGATGDIANAFENAIGTAFNDIIGGNALANRLAGGAGNDVIQGFDGNDVLIGDAGNDALFGGAGNESILGEAGDDFIVGGTGNDGLRGGAGKDTFFFSANDGTDRLVDFDPFYDKIIIGNASAVAVPTGDFDVSAFLGTLATVTGDGLAASATFANYDRDANGTTDSVRISYGNGSVMTIENWTIESLTAKGYLDAGGAVLGGWFL